MVKFKHVFTGDFWRKKLVDGKLCDDFDYNNFLIDVPIPIAYDTKEEAVACNCSLRFEVEDGHVVLRIYSDWIQGEDENGKWFEHVHGHVVDTIYWEEHWKYKTIRSKGLFNEMGGFSDARYDYLPDATPWDELFDIKNQPDGWAVTVEGLAYEIQIVDV